MVKSFEERFWEKVMPEPMSGCWIWIGARNNHGYGQIQHVSKRAYAHRISYEMHIGKIPRDYDVDHKCRTPSCINPAHLEAVTHAENMARGIQAAAKFCKRGHEFTAENTYLQKGNNGKRKCRECQKMHNRKRYENL